VAENAKSRNKNSPGETQESTPAIEVKGLDMGYGSYILMRDINFKVMKGEVMVIMGGSGCGKSTLLKYMIGLKPVEKGDILYYGHSFAKASVERPHTC
jgi:phospholipid/cholesterol/gamma-HCH transport system ATP-binding protein